jgi:hypothetical protein
LGWGTKPNKRYRNAKPNLQINCRSGCAAGVTWLEKISDTKLTRWDLNFLATCCQTKSNKGLNL